jgi:asparagine synthase (glutamine-hydrolysing)
MANFLGLINSNSCQEKNTLFEQLKNEIKLFPWLTSTHCEHDDFSLEMAAISNAPLFISENNQGDYCLVLGNMFPALPNKNQAEWLLNRYQDLKIEAFNADGDFYFACIHLANGDIVLGTDSLGIFPVYYAAINNSLFFSTAPNLIRNALEKKPSLDIQGLVGHLLTMHVVGEQTLWQQIYRMTAGEVFIWNTEKGLRSLPINKLLCTTDYFDKSLEDCQHYFDQTLADVTRPTSSNVALLLSGGLDSRLIVGYLTQKHKTQPICYTLGSVNDNEYYCARKIAKQLSLSHTRIAIDDDAEKFVDLAYLQLKTESLANGFNDLSWWTAVTDIKEGGYHQFNGFLGDSSIGGSHIPWAYDKEIGTFTFDKMFGSINKWGLTPDQVTKLILPEVLGDSIEANLDSLRAQFEGNIGLPYQRAWYYDLTNRQRFHVGASSWRLSFSMWPIIPFANKKLLRLAAGMPGAVIMKRAAQQHMLIHKFPHLAVLPMDRNSMDLSPLCRPPLLARVCQKIDQKIHTLKASRQNESRYYYRVYDLNNKNWTRIRKEAVKDLSGLAGIMNLDYYKTITQNQNSALQLVDVIVSASPIKTLLGLSLLLNSEITKFQ